MRTLLPSYAAYSYMLPFQFPKVNMKLEKIQKFNFGFSLKN